MASHRKEFRRIADVIKPYGYSIVKTSKHSKIVNKQGKCIYTLPGSPSDGNFWRQCIRDLIRLNLIKKEDRPW